MSKNRGVQYSREEWLARRDNPSMGRVLRSRGHYRHISVPIRVVDEGLVTEHRVPVMPGTSYFVTPEKYRLFVKGTDVVKGRNQRKRAHRATKSARKYWKVVA